MWEYWVVTYEWRGVGEDECRGGSDAVGGNAREGEQLARLHDQQHPQGGGACGSMIDMI